MSDASLNAACGHTRRRFLSRTLIAGGGLAAVGLGAGAIAPAYGMRGNFYSPATLTPDGRGVAAGGPLEWDADDVAATIVITVSQRGLTAAGAGRYDSGDAAWWESLAVAGAWAPAARPRDRVRRRGGDDVGGPPRDLPLVGGHRPAIDRGVTRGPRPPGARRARRR